MRGSAVNVTSGMARQILREGAGRTRHSARSSVPRPNHRPPGRPCVLRGVSGTSPSDRPVRDSPQDSPSPAPGPSAPRPIRALRRLRPARRELDATREGRGEPGADAQHERIEESLVWTHPSLSRARNRQNAHQAGCHPQNTPAPTRCSYGSSSGDRWTLELAEELAGDVALDAPFDLAVRLALGAPPLSVRLRGRVVAKP